jgi:hypothetical protein
MAASPSNPDLAVHHAPLVAVERRAARSTLLASNLATRLAPNESTPLEAAKAALTLASTPQRADKNAAFTALYEQLTRPKPLGPRVVDHWSLTLEARADSRGQGRFATKPLSGVGVRPRSAVEIAEAAGRPQSASGAGSRTHSPTRRSASPSRFAAAPSLPSSTSVSQDSFQPLSSSFSVSTNPYTPQIAKIESNRGHFQLSSSGGRGHGTKQVPMM